MSERTLLESIDAPEDLRKLSIEELYELARELREYIIECVSQTGGHLSSNLGSVELAIALHYVFDTPTDRIVWDVGHQAYAHKVLTGRREALRHIRQFGGISGFPRRGESKYDTFGVGHASTSISAALGMAVASHLEGHDKRWHVAVIGDGALTGGMVSEALNHAGDYKEGVKLLIILNDNECSISRPVGALCSHMGMLVSSKPFWTFRNFGKNLLKRIPLLHEFAKRVEKQTVNMMSPNSSIFSTYDLTYFGPVDGNNLGELTSILRKLKNLQGPMGPIVLHVRSVKGKGYALAEADPTTYHGVDPFDPSLGVEKDAPHGRAPYYTQIFSDWLCDMGEVDPKLYAITPAMSVGSGLVRFAERFPKRYRDVAICEEHSVTYAAGLACEGLHPVVAIYSTFAQRAYDQILHDVALQNLPVTFAVDRAGIVGHDGATHHGLYDIAFLRSMPNMTIMVPSDEDECRRMLTTAVKLGSPAAVRYPRHRGTGVVVDRALTTLEVGKSRTVREGHAKKGARVVIFAFGPILARLLAVAETFDATVVDMRFAKPLDEQVVKSLATKNDLVVTAEEGVTAGGAGSAVLEVLAREGILVETLLLGIPDTIVLHGSIEELMKTVGLDEASIKAQIEKRLNAL